MGASLALRKQELNMFVPGGAKVRAPLKAELQGWCFLHLGQEMMNFPGPLLNAISDVELNDQVDSDWESTGTRTWTEPPAC